jgi:UDP-N-acetylmuramate dehydrogenase
MQAAHLMATPQYRGEVINDEPMARHTSWRAGGLADRFYKPADLSDLATLLQSLPEDEALLWMGLGSNTLVRDGGFRGSVIATQGVMSQLERTDKEVMVGAGVPSAKLAKFCSRENLVGAEFFAGIPGLVGGALAMNAGAFGGETWKHVEAVETINRQGVINKREANEYEVGYRSVVGPKGEWFIGATMKFEEGESGKAVDDIKELLAKRAQTQPTGSANSGSVFRNPVSEHAANLIELCDLKGERIGGAIVSEKHANFIINDNQASAEDIEKLIMLVQKTVDEKFNIKLQTEVRIVGEHA